MRLVDLDNVRPKIGEFSLTVDGEKKTFIVMKPTLKQRTLHQMELDQVIKDAKKLEKNGAVKQPDHDNLLAKWFHRQIQIFIPEFGAKDAEVLVEEQRDAILDMVFERNNDTAEMPKKEKKTKESRGQK